MGYAVVINLYQFIFLHCFVIRYTYGVRPLFDAAVCELSWISNSASFFCLVNAIVI
jgi:hypothetical protein